MLSEEGVIKYHLSHSTRPLPDSFEFEDLMICRQNLFQEGLIGQDAQRYGGFGYGNVSCRVENDSAFIITGSQTGHLPELQREHFVLVTKYQRSSNTLTSQGQIKPSSESSTHAFFYALNRQINAVIHVHSPRLWHFAASAGLPATNASTPYGSMELLEEIESLWNQDVFADSPFLAMLGHTDGVVCFGNSLPEAEATLWKYWQEAD